jgi:hypothetical protein
MRALLFNFLPILAALIIAGCAAREKADCCHACPASGGTSSASHLRPKPSRDTLSTRRETVSPTRVTASAARSPTAQAEAEEEEPIVQSSGGAIQASSASRGAVYKYPTPPPKPVRR